MTAKELHDLYAPLWALVPETNPNGLVMGREVLHHGLFGMIHTEAAAALCRVAVEDWLHAQEYSTTIGAIDPNAPDCDKWVELYWPGHPDADPERSLVFFPGPTIHHALVAAALAVAGKENA